MDTVNASPRRYRGLFSLLFVLLFTGGCSSKMDNSWSSRQEVLDLPANQQQEIARLLLNFHGSYNDPRIRLISDEEEEEEYDAEEDDEADAEDEEDGDADDEDEDDEEEQEPELTYVDLVDPLTLKHGRNVFNKYCAGCHGVTGDGEGPAAEYLYPPPRDYRPGVFKFTSTPDNYKPRREDLRRIIRVGAKGTSMPAFRWLSDQDMNALIDYVILLSRRGELERELAKEASDFDEEDFDDEESLEEFREIAHEWVTTIDERWEEAKDEVVTPAVPNPPKTEETILAGRDLFFHKDQSCFTCHGADGRGGIEDPDANLDAWGKPIVAADLTTGMYHGGARPIDLYRRIHSGITSRMPAFGNAFEDDPEKIWYLVHFVQAFGEGVDIEIPKQVAEGHAHATDEDEEDEASVEEDDEEVEEAEDE